MWNSIKNFLILGLVLLCVGLGVSTYIFYNKPAQKVVVPKEVEKLVNIEADRAAKKIKDKGGIEHAILDDKHNLIKEVAELDPASRDTIQKLAERLNISERDLKSVTTYVATIERKYQKLVKLNDTTYRHSNPNLTVDFHLRNGLEGSSRDTSYINYKYQAGVNYAEYEKGGFLGIGKKSYIDVWLDDPNATINGLQRFRIEPKKDQFGVNVNASGMLFQDKPYVGPGVDVRIGRSVISAEYMRDFKEKKWTPMFKYKFNLLEL